MPGPIAKPANMRQRRNKVPTAAALGETHPATYRPLPARQNEEVWHERAVSLWESAWHSPMAAEYVEADIEGLLVCVELTHKFWLKPDAKTAAELRSQRLSYGLDPKARRGLQWEIARAKEATKRTTPTPAPRRNVDPRLRLVSSG